MILWIDDVRPAPGYGYNWIKSVNRAIEVIVEAENIVEELNAREGSILEPLDWSDMTLRRWMTISLIDIDHDAGEFADDGGDYIKLLDWLEETGRNYPIRIHSQNPVGVQNMRRIIERNGWKEIR